MHNASVPTLRRSSRVPITVPMLVTSLEPGARFSEVCETLEVSVHGCAMRSPMKLETGVPLHFHNQDGRETTAQVVYCQPIGTGKQGWKLGASFDSAQNFWELQSYPKDWATSTPAADVPPAKRTAANLQIVPPNPAAASAKIVLDRIKKQLSDDHLKAMLAGLVQPLEAEITGLKEKLARGSQKNKFEVSLSQIPPELEQQLELRLRNQLGPQVLEQAKQQSEQVLEAAKKAIAQKTTDTHADFLQRVAQEFRAVEERAQGVSTDVAQSMREHLNRGMGELHQQVVDAGNRLKRLSEDLLRVMEHTLGEEHDSRLREFEQVREAVASESSRLQEQISDLDRRMAELDESARRLESGLDKRLSQMASDTVRTARAQMESALEVALNELSTRNAQELGNQLDEASANLKLIQKGIEGSVAESLKTQVAESLQSFEHSMEELAERSVERWRVTLAGGLNSLVRTLGEQFTLQAASENNAGRHARVK